MRPDSYSTITGLSGINNEPFEMKIMIIEKIVYKGFKNAKPHQLLIFKQNCSDKKCNTNTLYLLLD